MGLSRCASVRLRGGPFPLTHFEAFQPIEQFADVLPFENRSVLRADHLGLDGANALHPSTERGSRGHPAEVKPSHVLDVLLEVRDDQAGMVIWNQGAADVTREQDPRARVVERKIT